MSEIASGLDRPKGGKGREAFRTISEVADELDLPQHVLRFWESKFTQIKPLKRGGNRRYYRPDDVVLLRAIKKLLHSDGYTIRGVQKLFKAQGLKATIGEALDLELPGVGADVPHEAEVEGVQEDEVVSDDNVSTVGDLTELKGILESLKALRARLS